MKELTDIELVETYRQAKRLKCSQEFLFLLRKEMKKRNIMLGMAS